MGPVCPFLVSSPGPVHDPSGRINYGDLMNTQSREQARVAEDSVRYRQMLDDFFTLQEDAWTGLSAFADRRRSQMGPTAPGGSDGAQPGTDSKVEAAGRAAALELRRRSSCLFRAPSIVL